MQKGIGERWLDIPSYYLIFPHARSEKTFPLLKNLQVFRPFVVHISVRRRWSPHGNCHGP